MTTNQSPDTPDSKPQAGAFSENLLKIEALSERLIKALSGKPALTPSLNAPNHEVFSNAAMQYWQDMARNPIKVFEQQTEYWSQTLQHFVQAQQSFAQAGEAQEAGQSSKDRRFSNPLWTNNPYFRLIKEQYLTNAASINSAVEGIEGLSALEKQRLRYFARQITDMMAPTNFLGTNPDALEKAIATEGQSLVDGLENLVSDIEANDGELLVRLADETAFELGRNIATTPGKVVFRNKMLELIQYEPTTEQVHQTPLIVFPPWINKFYILDLKAQNSFIKWVTEQGYTLFVVSWVNPDTSHSDVGMEEYIEEGFLTAIEQVKSICGVKQVNAIGYCIAGTTLALTLALLNKRKDRSVKSATFFTALTDFSDQGEFTPFLQNDFIDGIEEEVAERGVLRSFIMARTFSFLRSNDLIYSPAIKSYMLGEAPPAFDLLYWNGDGANLPGKMAVQYLRGLCQDNRFADGGFEILGETLNLSDVAVPLCSIACETDHIAAWRDCYRGVQQMGSKDRTFILAQSGHIAGIVNPPAKKKYGYYMNEALDLAAPDWHEGAEHSAGSWWPVWEGWLRKRAGKKIPARQIQDETLADAPGTYVAKSAKL